MINIDDLTLGQIKEISKLTSQPQVQALGTGLNGMIGKVCIIRTYSAGVWFGEVSEKSGKEVIIKNARRMWQWKASKSISLSAVAIYGIDHDGSKIAPAVDLAWLEAIELIPCTEISIKSIIGAKDVEAK